VSGTRRRIARIVEKHRGEVEGLLLRRYPAFVLGGESVGAEIPTFAFHEVDAETLEPMLEFLAANGYRTLTADEYLERGGRLAGSGSGAAREVLLTFDDGHVSLHRVAWPALARLGLKAVAYVVPGRVPEPANGDGAARVLCDWGEIAAMHGSGVIDVQSHSLLHHSIAVSNRIVDFCRPGVPAGFMEGDLAPVTPDRRAPAAGAPIHAWGARYASRPAWREAPEVTRACEDEVARNGGETFFARHDWRARLLAVATATRRHGRRGAFESDADRRAAILADLGAARAALEARLPGKTVRHFCYPWYRGSPLAARLAREAGMLTHAWGSIVPRFATGPDMPLAIRRLPPELLWRLPGEGRRPLRSILGSRWTRTLAGARRGR
jgi:peptidoglycan/xylan/chitin deacetylase (PgdA/CDA1 family)